MKASGHHRIKTSKDTEINAPMERTATVAIRLQSYTIILSYIKGTFARSYTKDNSVVTPKGYAPMPTLKMRLEHSQTVTRIIRLLQAGR